MESQNINIVQWPKEQPAILEHHFLDEKSPMHVNMNMRLDAEGQLPMAIRLSEPICAESSYKISLNLMGQPFAEVVIKGITRLFNCYDKQQPVPQFTTDLTEPPTEKTRG